MAGEPDPHLASLTADDDGGMIDKSPIIISSGGAEEVDDLMVRIISTNTDDSNDNKNGANETTTTTTAPQEEDNTTLMGKMNNNNNPLQTLGSNDSNTCIDLSPPLASLETASNETMLVMAATNNDADDDGHQHQQVIEPSCHAQEGEGSATTIKVINAKSSDDSSDTVNCSDASTINAAGPAMAAQTSAIVSDDIASHSDSNTLKNSDDANTNNISSNNSGNDHNMISERDVQLLEILNHRRKLLTWVRACRIQTQIVLREMSTSSNKGGNEKDEVEEQQQQRRQRRRRQGLITTLESSTTLQDGEDLSGTANQIMQPGGGEGFGLESLVNSEMATFQAITNMANRNPNSLKRPRPPSSVTESSNPRDLRRGPSVGKSFDACTTASASGSVSMPGGGGRSTTTTIHASPSTVSLPNAVEAQTSSSSSSTMTTIGKQFLNKNQPPHEDVPPTTSTLSNHASTSSFAIATSNTEKQKKSRKRKSNSNNNNSTFTNHDRLGSTLPFPPGGSSSHMTMTNNNAAALMRGNANNNSASSQMLSALVPSAAAVDLLAVRNGLLARLDSLLLQKPKKQRCGGPSDGNDITPPRMDVDQNDDDGVHVNMHDALSVGIDCKPTIDRDGNCSIPSVIGKRMPIPVVSQLVSSTGEKFGTAPAKYSPLSEAAVTIQPNELHSHLHHHPAPPLRLPIRRKTHWDCVLEEMKWSAADFHEERKWKIAAGQLLSASVRKYKPKKKKLSSSSSLVGITPTKLSQASRSGSIVSSSSRSTTMSVNSFSLNTSGFCMASNESSTFDPLYVDASIEDTETVRIISRLLSVGILDHWDSISSSSRYCEDMNARQQRFRRLVELESLGNDTVKLVRSKESNGHAQLGETSTRPRDDESLQSSNSTGAIRELRYDEISERIESSFKLAVMLKDQVVTTSLSKISSCGEMMGVELDQRQLRAVHFVERLWASTNGVKEGGSDTSYIEGAQMSAFNNDARSSISAIVGGSFGVGKTVAVCTLIWRNKIDGPQIVVCSPGAVIRWMHELKKFDDLICRCYSRGDSRAAFTSYNDSDVVVCDYGLLREFVDNNDRCPSIANFAAMFLDLRHCGWTSIRDKQQSSSTTKPSSLDSVQWWVCLNNFIAKCPTSMKRLVIEQPDHRQNCFVAPISGYDSLGGNEGSDKRSRKLLAMRVAFIFHPSTFVSERGSVGKRVISWAKFQAESSSTANETTTGDLALLLCKGSGALPSRGWSSVVSSVFDAMPADVEKKLPTNFSWKLHMCSLGKSQQLAYNKCFANMRRNSDNAIADGLLELRKACMHSTLQESTASLVAPLRRHNPKDRFVGKHGSSILSCSATSSESNIELARTIMKKSSKMKELLRVLVTEGGFKVARGMALFGSSSDCGEDPISVKKAPVEKAKVLILATLVEAQLLASSFLSAVGLHHEVLVSSVANQYSTPPSTMSSVESEHSWAWCQECLSRFNNASLERPIDILIASPMTVSSLSCGIGLANADFVISIDEDWSGREASHIMSIFSKIYWSRLRAPVDAASSAANDSCKFIKLVCRNTCECAFLYNDSAQDCHAGIVQSNKKGPRRSSRQSTRTSKSNQHEPVGGIEHDDTRKIQTGLCPIQVVPAAAFTNADGFVVPANGGSGKSHMSPLDQCFVATNILRYRNSKLSTVFAVSSVGSDVLFLPTKQCLDHSVMASESDLAFAWALFNAEDRAFFHSTIPTRNFGVRPIISSPTVAFLVDGTSVRRYVESFKRSTSFIPGKQSFQPIHLRSERLVSGESMASGRDSTCTFASSTDLGRKTDLFDDDNSELLVYGLPDDVSRKRKLSAADFDSSRGESAQNIFSFCYSVINSTPATLLNHGNEGYESLVYFPPFFPYLLQEIETNALSPLNICAELPSRTSSEFTFTIETNPHAFCGVQMKVGNEEMSFHRMLLIADLQDPITHQSDLSLNSLILVSQKKRQQHRNNSNAMFELAGPILSDSLRKCSDGEGKKSLNKKLKRQHHHINSSSARDKGHSYFHNERLLEQACFARGKFDASNLGRIRLNCRLNDLVSISFDQSFSNLCIPYQSEMRCHQSNFYGSLPNRRNIAPVLLGAIPLANEELAFRKNKYRSGIILPVGVKTLRKEMPCSSSMEESAEPWTSIEDSILNGCVSRYGMNWQLAAYAVSSGMSCSTEIVGRDETFRKAIRRSAAQCHHRWSSILSENSSTATRLTGMHNNGSGAITRETSLFVTKMDSMQRESIIFDGLLPSTRVEQMSDQKNSTILLGQPSQVQRSQFANESISHRLAHLQKLKEASSKRIVINTPLPSSAPTHPSHSEAIQAARASMLSAASVTAPPRHEMWPLELLDFRKQQNTEAKEAPNPAPASSQSPYRHQSSVPHHVPHTIHPAQPHMIYHEAGHFPPPPHQPYRQYQQPGHVHPGPDSNVIYQPQPKTQRRQH